MTKLIAWLRARLGEASTWLGLALVVASLLANRLGYDYADVKDALMLLGGGLVAHPESAAS